MFHCDSTHDRNLTLLYLQRGEGFREVVAEYHATEETPKHNNTRVNPTDRTVNMADLKVSDKGEYKCVISYTDSTNSDTEDTTIFLHMTGEPTCPSLNQTLNNNIGLIHI